MDYNFCEIFSPYLIAAFLGYFVAQFSKGVIYSLKNRRFNWREFFQSGHMPSSHAAVALALATTIGLKNGWGSAIFAVAFIFAIVVVYDATHVRRATGEQGRALKPLIKRYNREKVVNSRGKDREHIADPYFSRGHTPAEATVGSLLGILIGFLVSLYF